MGKFRVLVDGGSHILVHGMCHMPVYRAFHILVHRAKPPRRSSLARNSLVVIVHRTCSKDAQTQLCWRLLQFCPRSIPRQFTHNFALLLFMFLAWESNGPMGIPQDPGNPLGSHEPVGLPWAHLWESHGPEETPWAYGNPMGPCESRGPLESHGPMRFPRAHWISMGIPWANRVPMGFSWESHGIPTGSPWHSHGNPKGPWGSHAPVGIPWVRDKSPTTILELRWLFG